MRQPIEYRISSNACQPQAEIMNEEVTPQIVWINFKIPCPTKDYYPGGVDPCLPQKGIFMIHDSRFKQPSKIE